MGKDIRRVLLLWVILSEMYIFSTKFYEKKIATKGYKMFLYRFEHMERDTCIFPGY